MTDSTPPHPAFPRIKDLTAVVPFATRWAKAREQRAQFHAWLESVHLVAKRDTGLNDLAKVIARGWFQDAWLRSQTQCLFRVDPTAFRDPCDVRAFCEAGVQSRNVVPSFDDRTPYSPEQLDRVVAGLTSLLRGDAHPGRDRDEMSKIVRTINHDRYCPDEDVDSPSPLLGWCELRTLEPVWDALPTIAPDEQTPPHPSELRMNFAGYLHLLRNWVLDVMNRSRTTAAGPGEGGRRRTRNARPNWNRHFCDSHARLLQALESAGEMSYSEAIEAVGRSGPNSRNALEALVSRINRKLSEKCDDLGGSYRIGRRNKLWFLDRASAPDGAGRDRT